MNSVSTLPMNLCLRPTEHPAGTYGVWSTKDIPVGMRFGPYRDTFIDVIETEKKKDFRWQMETEERKIIILDGNNETDSNWLRYVNYASNREQRNLIAIESKWDGYYVTTKAIPANVELLVWYEEGIVEERRSDRKGCRRKHPIENAKGLQGNSRRDAGKKRARNKIKSTQEKERYQNKVSKNEVSYIYNQCIPGGPLILSESIKSFRKFSEYKECGKKFKSSNDINLQKRRVIRKKRYMRNVYGKKFNFKVRNRIYTSEKHYDGYKCGKKFIQSGHIKLHKKTQISLKPYECNICGKKFSSKRNLELHNRIHTGEVFYECNECGKKFNYVSHFKAHNRIHTGEKPYECNECGKKFAQSTNLKRHEKYHFGEKQYECNVCGKKFVSMSNLNLHNKVHIGDKPYECNICEKKFIWSGNYKRHYRIHTGEKPYDCNECGKKFTQSGHLKLHKMAHIGLKQYECNTCGKKFVSRSNLNSHNKIHTKAKP